jgi:hypothetical protein
MNKLRIATIITVIIVLLVFAIILSSLHSNNQTGNSQTPTPTMKPITNIHITNFHFTNFFPAEGLSWHAGFIIEITNNETERVDNLTLTFVSESPYNMTRTIRCYNNTYPSDQGYVEMGQPWFLNPLQQGEAKVLHGAALNNMDDSYKIRGYALNVTLRIDDTVLDQATIMIP